MAERKRLPSPMRPPKVSIAEEVIASIAGIAAAEVEGLGKLKGSVADGLAAILGESRRGKGVAATQRSADSSLHLRLKISVRYGYSIPEVAKRVQVRVKQEIESMTGLPVKAIDVYVQEILLPETETEEG